MLSVFPHLAGDVGDADLLQEFAVPGSGMTRHYGSHGETMGPVTKIINLGIMLNPKL